MVRPVANHDPNDIIFSSPSAEPGLLSGLLKVAKAVIKYNPIVLLVRCLWKIGSAILENRCSKEKVSDAYAQEKASDVAGKTLQGNRIPTYAEKAVQAATNARKVAEQANAKAAEAKRAVKSAKVEKVESVFATRKKKEVKKAAKEANRLAAVAEHFAKNAVEPTQKAKAAQAKLNSILILINNLKLQEEHNKVSNGSGNFILEKFEEEKKVLEKAINDDAQEAAKNAENAAKAAAAHLEIVNNALSSITHNLLIAKGDQVVNAAQETVSEAEAAQTYVVEGISRSLIKNPGILEFFEKAKSKAKLAVDKAHEAKKNASAAMNFSFNNDRKSAEVFATKAQAAAAEALEYAGEAKGLYALAIALNSRITVSAVEWSHKCELKEGKAAANEAVESAQEALCIARRGGKTQDVDACVRAAIAKAANAEEAIPNDMMNSHRSKAKA